MNGSRDPRDVSASEQRLRSVLASLQDLLFVYDENGVYIDFHSPQGSDLLFRRPSEFIGKRYDQIGFPPAVVRQIRDALGALRAGAPMQTFDYALDMPAGRRWFMARLTRWVDAEGRYAGAVVLVTDTTDRVLAERERRARYRQQEAVVALGRSALAGAAPHRLMDEAVAFVADALGTECAAVLEMTPDRKEMLLCAGVGWREGMVGQFRVPAQHRSLAGYAILSGGPLIVPSLGQETRFEVPPVLFEHGIVSVISVVIRLGDELYGVLNAHTTRRRDFTERDAAFLQSVAHLLASAIQRQRAEAALRESEERFRHLLQSIRDMVWSSTLDSTKLLYVNQAVEHIYGVSPEEFERDMPRWFAAVHPEDLPRVIETASLLERQGTAELEYRIVRPDGEVRWVYDRATVILDESGAPARKGGIVTDITELKRLEEELRQAQKMEAVGRLAGGVAHDFNNLLTAILGYCQLALERLTPDHPVRPDIQEIVKAGERASDLTSQLLAFGRRQMLQPRVLDLNAVVRDLTRLLGRLLGPAVRLESRLGAARPWVRADSGQLEQILVNLSLNARDAMPGGGTLTIETADAEGRVALLVADTGTGMDPDTLARAFEPFFTTKERGRGTGLGLSTVYGIVKQSGGDIAVASAAGAGTTFRIILPAVGAPAEEPARARAGEEAAGAAVGGPATGPSAGTVLLVEDEEAVRELVRGVLEARGYHVLLAADGQGALLESERHGGPIDLLITDLIMPGMSGGDLAACIMTSRPALRVLYMSGYTDESLAPARLERAGTAYLQKPFTLGALMEAVREVLGAPAAQ